jgi:hypothetical protein
MGRGTVWLIGDDMRKLIIALMFLAGNFTYQYMQVTPDYWVAIERCIYQAWAMLFIVHYPRLLPNRKLQGIQFMTEKLPRFERVNDGSVALVVSHQDEFGNDCTFRHFISEKTAKRLLGELVNLEPKRQASNKQPLE